MVHRHPSQEAEGLGLYSFRCGSNLRNPGPQRFKLGVSKGLVDGWDEVGFKSRRPQSYLQSNRSPDSSSRAVRKLLRN